jgi:hypothetical protein
MSSAELFDRRFALTVGTLDVSDFHCRFRVEKTLKPEPNKALIEIWNLSPDHRALLGELAPGKKIKLGKKKGGTAPSLLGKVPCRLEVGYAGPGTDLLFLGDLRTVDTEIDGPDWVTSISSGDGERAFRTARINQSFGAKVPTQTALRALVKALGVGEGNLSKVVSQLKLQGQASLLTRGIVLSGPVSRLMTDYCRAADLEWSIQDGALQFVDLNKALSETAIKLTPDTGLVGSPSVDAAGVMQCKCLLIPGLRCGRIVVLDAAEIKGQFRIESFVAEGDTHGDDWTAEIKAKRY